MDFLNTPIPAFVLVPKLFIVLLIVISAAFGSFFTMYCYRLPIMIQAWKNNKKASVNLCFPASHCPQCKTKLKSCHNFPLLGYLIQRGKCVFCQTKIPIRYFLIESGFVLFSLLAVWIFKISYLTLLVVCGTWLLLLCAVLFFYFCPTDPVWRIAENIAAFFSFPALGHISCFFFGGKFSRGWK